MIETWWLMKKKENKNRVGPWKPNTDGYQEGGSGHCVNSTEKSRKIRRRKCLGWYSGTEFVSDHDKGFPGVCWDQKPNWSEEWTEHRMRK